MATIRAVAAPEAVMTIRAAARRVRVLALVVPITVVGIVLAGTIRAAAQILDPAEIIMVVAITAVVITRVAVAREAIQKRKKTMTV